MLSALEKTVVVGTVALVVGAGVLVACSSMERQSVAWKQADLDRNWLDLAVYRGVEDADDFAAGMGDRGQVVSAKGIARRGVAASDLDEPLEIVILYSGRDDSGAVFAQDDPDTCYRFTVPTGYSSNFAKVDCPG
ncbi:hypothetical protein GL325_10530 [Aeromicrobium sp. 636]|uniref:Lipoprotein n=1 Tax=Aeromicrobium senzhongii TaxID=2663859 RepID=A0A8I0K083_9ACTN|nr:MULTISPECIES: hypothetical protein [Aeromicrobium]MBC9226762.1 hypothetical protein [Aeromicrobium senzhongii]MCQ3998863.1 hypothetical protein [Aeromicrobium sp. 636]